MERIGIEPMTSGLQSGISARTDDRLADELENLTPAEPLIAGIGGRKVSPKATNKNNELAQVYRYLGLPVENVSPTGASSSTKTGQASTSSRSRPSWP
jgi:hypothetical protein